MSCFGHNDLDCGRSSVYRLAGSQGVKYRNTFVTSLRSSDITEAKFTDNNDNVHLWLHGTYLEIATTTHRCQTQHIEGRLREILS